MASNGLSSGAVLFMDALGFKGIWKRHNPHLVLEEMRKLKASLESMLDNTIKDSLVFLKEFGVNLEPTLVFLSDSILCGVSVEFPNEAPHRTKILARQSALVVAVAMGAQAQFEACNLNTPLAFRGAITFGQFGIAQGGSFIIGSAVDEAVENSSLIESGLIALMPSALSVSLEYGVHERQRPFRYHRLNPPNDLPNDEGFTLSAVGGYRLQLKGGAQYETAILNPLEATESGDEEEWIIRYLETFDMRSLSIASKAQNTKDFLDDALDVVRDLRE